MPGTKAVGIKTAAKISAMAITGPVTSSIALTRSVVRRHSLLDVVLDRLDNNDGIVDDQSNRQHQSKQRQSVDGKSEHWKDDERSD